MIIDIDEISKQWKLDEPQLDILGPASSFSFEERPICCRITSGDII